MVRLFLSFTTLFVGAAALIALLPKPKPHEWVGSGVATELRAGAHPRSGKVVRIVYPPTVSIPGVAPNAAGAPEPKTATPDVAQPANAAAGETETSDAGQRAGSIPPADIDAILRATAKIDINTASVDALDQIPGGGRIGRAIASGRPYRSVEDLLSKRVLRKNIYERIKDEVAAKWDVAGAQ